MRRLLLLFLAAGLLALGFQSCKYETAPVSENELDQLDRELKSRLRLDCTADSDCTQIAVGSRPCGGPAEYLIYSRSSSDEEAIEFLAQQITELEERYNRENDMVGTCIAILPYEGLNCAGGLCAGGPQPFGN